MLFDNDAVFDADYLYFYHATLSPEQTAKQVAFIWNHLGLAPGMTVLDLACGHGRIANELAARGAIVTGLDASQFFLEQARDDAAARGIENVTFVHGDMRDLPWAGHFDVIINWFTAFGYLGDEEDRHVLRACFAALKPGGKLAIEHINRDRIVANLLPSVVTERDGNFMIDRTTFDMDASRTHTERVVIRDGTTRRFQFSVRMFTVPELREWLRSAGFATATSSDETGAPISPSSRRLVMLATKPADRA